MTQDLKTQISQNSGFASKARKELADFLGTVELSGVVVQKVDVTAAANSSAKTFDATYDMHLIAVIVRATAAAASSTLQLRNATTAITDAVDCAVDTTLTFATTITDADQELEAGTEYNLLAAGTNASSVRGEAYLVGYRTSTDLQ